MRRRSRHDPESGVLVDLLRHGQPEGGALLRGSRDDALSPLGWAQMWGAVGSSCPWSRIVSSPLRRCAEFAGALARHHGLPFAIDDRLREMHFGELEGLNTAQPPAADSGAVLRLWSDPATYTAPGGESFASLRHRVLESWRSHCVRPADGHVLLIVHGGPIRVILGEVLELAPPALARVEVPHAALSRVRVGEEPADRICASLVFHAGRL